MGLRITIPNNPTAADREAVGAPLLAYNSAHGRDPRLRTVAILLTDEIVYDWLFVEWLAVPERYRGLELGTQLMHEAEKIAQADDCVGLWLDTFEFQARGFYEKLGFEVFGTLEDHPIGQSRYFFRKRIR